jgi:hypothetical protein
MPPFIELAEIVMKLKVLVAGGLMSLAASSSFATIIALSNFTTDTEDWLANNGSQGLSWMQSGGSPGGFIQAKDADGGSLWFFSAPAKFVVQAPKAYGGSLLFDLRVISVSPPTVESYADVQLVANDGSMVSYFGDFNPTPSWASYVVPLVANDSWVYGSTAAEGKATAEQMQAVLSNLAVIRIRGDYRQKGEATGLDSVALVQAPVPEPATAAMWLAGLGFLGWMFARRRGAAILSA